MSATGAAGGGEAPAPQTGLVSTVIPVHNRPRLLREAVQSVLAQEYRPIEIVIVDDGSTDDTGSVADELARAHPGKIRVLHQPNAGPGAAREAGLRLARGEFVQYLDSDDLLLPGKFERQVAGLREQPECGVSYGWTRYRRADGTVEPLPWKGSGERVETMFPAFLSSRWWDTPTPLYRAAVCRLAGPWSGLRLEEDWEYDCRVASCGVRLHHVAAYVAEVRDHAEGRLCRGAALDPDRLRQRATAHELILGHALRFGITADAPEMRRYARELFLLSRQCGAAGLALESRRLFELARSASGGRGAGAAQFRVYRALAALFGWSAAGRWACRSDALRERIRGARAGREEGR